MSDHISNENAEQILTKRVRCDYDLLHQDIMELRKQNVLNELKILRLTEKSVIFENQKIIANRVLADFKNREIINIMVLSKTQSGKTGSMCATIKQYLEDTSNLIPIENIYIITGLSSCEWKDQTKERMPESIQSRVFHRCELPNTFVDEIKNKKNILIIMDEIQVAAKKGQTIYKTFKTANLLDKSKLYEKDIKILEYTATPDGTIYDLMEWGDASSKILAEGGVGYVSSYDLLQLERVKQYKELCGFCIETYLLSLDKENIFHTLKNDCIVISDYIIQNIIDDLICNNDLNEALLTKFWSSKHSFRNYDDIINMDILKDIYLEKKKIFENIQEIKNDIDKYSNPLYHIIRTKNGIEQDLTIKNFKKIFNSDSYDFNKYDTESLIEDINKTLILQPEKHTFIFIKEMLRCAKTLKKKFIGILYDRYNKNPDDTTIIQGLVGRDTGYDNNGISICYTNINSIERYEELWKSKFENKTIRWNSKTTKYTNVILSGKNTYKALLHPQVASSVASEESNEEIEEPQPIIKRKSFDVIKKWFNDNLKTKGYGNGPKKKTKDDDGFYKCITQFNKDEKIRTNDEFKIYEKNKKWGFRGNTQKSKEKNKYRVYPVYNDETDINSLEWWLIYY